MASESAADPDLSAAGPRKHRLRRAGAGLVVVAVLLTLLSVTVNALTSTPVTAPPGLDYVQAGDVRTRIRVWAPPENAAGGRADGPADEQPIVLVHGAAETADTWTAVAERLATRHRVVALDLVGWGYSQRVAPYDLDHQTRQLLATIDALGLRRPVLVGHSSGAAAVAEAALRAPGAVGGVVFLDGDALATGAGARSPLRHLLLPPWRTTALRLALGSNALIRSVYTSQCGPRCPPLDASGVDEWRRPMQVDGAEDGLWAMLGEGVPGLPVPRLSRLAALPMPKAVVFGAEDGAFPAGTPAQTATRIGAPAPTLIPGARHLTLISDPEAVAAAIESLVRV